MSCKHLVRTCVVLLGVLPLVRGACLVFFCNDDASLANNITVPLDQAATLMTNKFYIPSRPTVMATYGFNGQDNGTTIGSILKAHILAKAFNVILLSWQREASAIRISSATDPFTIPLSYVASGLEQAFIVGTQCGCALVQMAKAGLDLLKTYLVGFSLGAQVFAIAARVVISAGLIIFRLIGLDPAGPFWGVPPTKLPSINAADAQHVFCLHTDWDHYGIKMPLCTVDMYANKCYYDQTNVQPGCPAGPHDIFTPEDFCNHVRSCLLYVESMTSKDLTGCKANSIGGRDCSDNVTLGMNWDPTKSGVYLMDTNSASPYGMGTATGSCP